MATSDWFAVQQLREGLFLVAEPMHVNNYLVVGSQRAVLFDTGMGISDIRAVVEHLTDLPVLVVNSHYHFDHVGGNDQFTDIAIHEAGVERLRQGPPAHWLPSYLDVVEETLAEYNVFRSIDEAWFQVLAPEMQMRALPAAFDRATWQTLPSVPTQLLHDGDELDLGDRVLRVLHTPGHTQDSICLLDDDARILLTGDTIVTGPMYAQYDDSSIESFTVSVRRLMTYADRVDVLLSAHGARYQSYPELIGRIADAFDEIGQGSAELFDTKDCFGQAVKEARFGDFSILV